MTEERALDGSYFRGVLGNFPTGVVAITALDADQQPVGMTVGTFASVSLDPPLVAFLPQTTSTTWPKIQRAGRFAVNILGEHQEAVCRALSSKGGDKFSTVHWWQGKGGAPLIESAVGWIECEIDAVHSAGDHLIVVGKVLDLETADDAGLPLLFFRGGYGRFSPLSFSAWDAGLQTVVRYADLARPFLESVVDKAGALECAAAAIVDDSLVLIATASSAEGSRLLSPRVGKRVPFHPPLGVHFIARSPEESVRSRWFAAAESRGPDFVRALQEQVEQVETLGYTEHVGEDWQAGLHEVEQAGDYGLTDEETRARQIAVLDSLEPAFVAPTDSWFRTINVPVVGSDGAVSMVLSVVVRESTVGVPRVVEIIKAHAAELSVAIDATRAQEMRDAVGSRL